MSKSLVIMPAYNEEQSIGAVLGSVLNSNRDFDVIVVNDCSVDKTSKIVRQKGTKVLNLPINLGIGGAMQTGYKYAEENKYDFAVQVDGDGQHDPKEIKKLIEAQQKTQANLVIGSRFLKKSEYEQTFFRMLGIRIFSVVARFLTGQKITDATSGFRLADKNVIELYANYYPTDYPEPEVLIYLHKKGMKIVETQVKMNQRQGGKSSITPIRSIYYMIKVVSSMFMQKMRGQNG